jgi:hypothetical protein
VSLFPGVVEAGIDHEGAGEAEQDGSDGIEGYTIRIGRFRRVAAKKEQGDTGQQKEQPEKGCGEDDHALKAVGIQAEPHNQGQGDGRLENRRSDRRPKARVPVGQPGIETVVSPDGVDDASAGEDHAVDRPQAGNADQEADEGGAGLVKSQPHDVCGGGGGVNQALKTQGADEGQAAQEIDQCDRGCSQQQGPQQVA